MIVPSESNYPKNFWMNDETQEKLKAIFLIDKYEQLTTSELINISKVAEKKQQILFPKRTKLSLISPMVIFYFLKNNFVKFPYWDRLFPVY